MGFTQPDTRDGLNRLNNEQAGAGKGIRSRFMNDKNECKRFLTPFRVPCKLYQCTIIYNIITCLLLLMLIPSCAEETVIVDVKGKTIQEVYFQYGNPEREFLGHYGLPDPDWASDYPNPITKVYSIDRGDIYVSFHADSQGELRCISWQILRKGEKF